MADIAEENFRRAGISEKVTLIRGDARQVVADMQGEGIFDVIFVDAAKGQYMEFFSHCERLLKKGGVLISDNVLYKGMTATDEVIDKVENEELRNRLCNLKAEHKKAIEEINGILVDLIS